MLIVLRWQRSWSIRDFGIFFIIRLLGTTSLKLSFDGSWELIRRHAMVVVERDGVALHSVSTQLDHALQPTNPPQKKRTRENICRLLHWSVWQWVKSNSRPADLFPDEFDPHRTGAHFTLVSSRLQHAPAGSSDLQRSPAGSSGGIGLNV